MHTHVEIVYNLITRLSEQGGACPKFALDQVENQN